MFCMDSLTLSWRKWTWKSLTSLCVIKKSCTNKGNVSLKHHFLKTLMQEFLSAVEPQMPRWHQNQRRCKHFHLHGRLRGWGLHICDRSIGPNALGRFNQSPRSTVVDGEEWPDPRRSPVSHSWFLTSCRSSRTPVCSEGQRKNMSHMSAPLTPSQPASQAARQPGTMSLTSPPKTINYWRGEMWWGSAVSTQRTHAFSGCHVA